MVLFSLAQAVRPGGKALENRISPFRGFGGDNAELEGCTWATHSISCTTHFVWGTARRELLIERVWRSKMLEILNEETKKRGGRPIRHNAMPDHLHLLVRLPPKETVSDFIGKAKGATSYRVNHELQPRHRLHWQEGYGALTLRKDELAKVSRYIDHQEEHHRSGRLSTPLETIDIAEDDWPKDAADRQAP